MTTYFGMFDPPPRFGGNKEAKSEIGRVIDPTEHALLVAPGRTVYSDGWEPTDTKNAVQTGARSHFTGMAAAAAFTLST